MNQKHNFEHVSHNCGTLTYSKFMRAPSRQRIELRKDYSAISLMRLNTNLYNRHHVARHHDDRWSECVQEQIH